MHIPLLNVEGTTKEDTAIEDVFFTNLLDVPVGEGRITNLEKIHVVCVVLYTRQQRLLHSVTVARTAAICSVSEARPGGRGYIASYGDAGGKSQTPPNNDKGKRDTTL